MKLRKENLYNFQKKVFEEHKYKHSYALFWEAGSGKTPTAATFLQHKFEVSNKILDTIIFTPIVTFNGWKEHLLEWTDARGHEIAIIKGTQKNKLKLLERKTYKIIIINYEAVTSKVLFDEIMKRKLSIAICDESHRIKSYNSKCARNIIKVSKNCMFKYILTGTPITNSPTDIWTQCLFLDNGKTFGHRVTDFRAKYMVNENAFWCSSGAKRSFPKWVLNPKKKGAFIKQIQSFSSRIKTKDVIELPELITQIISVDITQEQTRIIRQLKQDLIAFLETHKDDSLVVTNALTKLLRINEVLSGFMRLENFGIASLKKNPRLDACMDLIQDCAPHKVIIFCVFKENYNQLSKALDIKEIPYAMLTGATPTEEKLKTVELFNSTKGGPRVLIANTHASGIGVNLKGARYKIYYSRNFSLEDYIQSQARNYRAGSIEHHDKVVDYHLVTRDTLDEDILNSLLEKKKFAQSIIDIKKSLRVNEK